MMMWCDSPRRVRTVETWQSRPPSARDLLTRDVNQKSPLYRPAAAFGFTHAKVLYHSCNAGSVVYAQSGLFLQLSTEETSRHLC